MCGAASERAGIEPSAAVAAAILKISRREEGWDLESFIDAITGVYYLLKKAAKAKRVESC
jgi:hypothetical protein